MGLHIVINPTYLLLKNGVKKVFADEGKLFYILKTR
jgi:hypothetical protein